jgi:hypothetical protein
VLIKLDGSQLMKYYKKCPNARKKLQEGIEYNRKARRLLLTGVIAGPVLLVGSLITSVAVKNFIPFAVGAPLGLASFGTFGGVGLKYKSKALQCIKESVNIYNAECYIPNVEKKKEEEEAKAKEQESGKDIEEEVERKLEESSKEKKTEKSASDNGFVYDEIRNQPGNSNLFGVGLNLLGFTYSPLNNRLSGGAFGFYTYKSIFSVEAEYRLNYLSNISGDYQNGIGVTGASSSNGGLANGPTEFGLNHEMTILAKYFIGKKEKKVNVDFKMGMGKKGVNQGKKIIGIVPSTVMNGYGLRLGANYSGLIVENLNGIEYASVTNPEFTSLATYQRSALIILGVSRIRFTDLKLVASFENRNIPRNIRRQTEYYLDVLFAPYISTSNISGRFIDPDTGQYFTQTYSTASTKRNYFGARIVLQRSSLEKGIVGVKYGAEIGIFPGIIGERFSYIPYACQLTFGVFFGGRTDGKQSDSK